MLVEVLSIEGSPNTQEAVEQSHEALESLGLADVPVVERVLKSAEEAAATTFAGSPTVLIDGVDIEPGAVPTGSLACRVYLSGGGMSGYPGAALIAEAIQLRMPR